MKKSKLTMKKSKLTTEQKFRNFLRKEIKSILKENEFEEEWYRDLDERTKKSISDIIAYQTLPPQIDYVVPYRRKADAAESFIETLRNKKDIYKYIEKKVGEYHNSPGSDADAMF